MVRVIGLVLGVRCSFMVCCGVVCVMLGSCFSVLMVVVGSGVGRLLVLCSVV